MQSLFRRPDVLASALHSDLWRILSHGTRLSFHCSLLPLTNRSLELYYDGLKANREFFFTVVSLMRLLEFL